jgi:regulator of cell morphogenesis and NO signaling
MMLPIMSHAPNVVSPTGTSLIDRTVGELVAERPGRSRVFQSFNIDFCCQGGRTLGEACAKKGVALEAVTEQLEAESADPSPPQNNPADLPPDELVHYIVKQHHEFLRRELPRLHAMAGRVAHVHGCHTPSLAEIFEIFIALEYELNSHMQKEEMILFPVISALCQGERWMDKNIDGPIGCLVHEHEEADQALARLRELSNGYQPPADACNTYRSLFAGLQDLEEDLHRHIHLENAVLFPAAALMSEASEANGQPF